jgi:uncharacterized membrane protein
MRQSGREAFSGGVFAIIITIMVLEVLDHSDFAALLPPWPVFMSYVLSFVYVGIYWNKPLYTDHPSKMTGSDGSKPTIRYY